jgi:hypothetical protein
MIDGDDDEAGAGRGRGGQVAPGRLAEDVRSAMQPAGCRWGPQQACSGVVCRGGVWWLSHSAQ